MNLMWLLMVVISVMICGVVGGVFGVVVIVSGNIRVRKVIDFMGEYWWMLGLWMLGLICVVFVKWFVCVSCMFWVC